MIDLCLTLAEESLSGLKEKIDRYSGTVPFIEVRLDYLTPPQLPPLPNGTWTSFVATCRPKREGGRYEGAEGDRCELLRKAAENGFAWLDLEHDLDRDLHLPSRTRIVRSYHRFEGFPQDLPLLFEKIRARPGDVTKLALSVSGTGQLVALLSFMESVPSTISHIILGMGPLGQPSRFLGGFLGNHWTYVAAEEENAAAPGQFAVRTALECYRLSSWDTVPALYGVLGNPVAHSLSPTLHNRLFAHYGLSKLYFPFFLDDLGSWFDYVGPSRLAFHGFSVTLPFKTDVLKYVDFPGSPVSALNTLKRKNSGWEGINTDYAGFLSPLTSRFTLKGKKAVVLGNGGVAHTVVSALQHEKARVVVVGRNRERVARFAARYDCDHALFSDLPLRADLCVNATPVGQYPGVEASPLREDQLDFDCVYDLVYHPASTRLLEIAERKGMEAISGMEMFVEQAALQFLAWTGIQPDRGLVQEIVTEISTEQGGSAAKNFREKEELGTSPRGKRSRKTSHG